MKEIVRTLRNLLGSKKNVVKKIDAKQEALVRLGREQFQKMAEIGIGLPVAFR